MSSTCTGNSATSGRTTTGVLTLALAVLGVSGPGCDKCASPTPGMNHNEPVTNVRGAVMPDPRRKQSPSSGFGRFRSALIQPLRTAEQTPRNEAYVYALYLQTPFDVGVVGKSLATAAPGPSSSCPPRWRIDVYTSTKPTTAYINGSCGLLKVDGRYRRYTAPLRNTLERYFQRALRRPTHRVARIRVPVELDYRKVRAAIRPRVLRVYLPSGPFSRNPFVRVSTRQRANLPSDLTRLDHEAQKLRRRTEDLMMRYAQALLDSHPEVAGFDGPYPVAESFERDLKVRYEVKIYFRPGTDPLKMRYQCARLEMHIEEVTVPRFYRVDAVLPVKVKLLEIRRMLAKLPLKPAVILWPMLSRPR